MREISTEKIKIGEHVIIDGVEYVAKSDKGYHCKGCDLYNSSYCAVPCGDCIMVKVEKQPAEEEDKDTLKPESNYRPYVNTDELVDEYLRMTGFVFSEYVKPLIWVRNKKSGDAHAITGYFGGYVKVSDEVISVGALYVRFTYLDLSPCGIKED